MNDLFTEKSIRPMLIGETAEPFDSPDFLFELKLDGERCVAYLDPSGEAELRNKRNMRMLGKVPELSEIYRNVRSRCILDGELVVMRNGKPDFSEIQRRSLTTNDFKIRLQAEKFPASYIAFDVLYHDGHETASLPLCQRKELLSSLVREDERLSVSRVIEEHGKELYRLTAIQQLEGVVAKRIDSHYFFDRRTKDWIKIKNLQDEDFVVCGVRRGEGGADVVLLGQYRNGELVYKGSVALGVSSAVLSEMHACRSQDGPPFASAPGGVDTLWLKPVLVCTVKYMMKNPSGSMRQPVFKGLREDKRPEDCVENPHS